jgi:hypothetical protein
MDAKKTSLHVVGLIPTIHWKCELGMND